MVELVRVASGSVAHSPSLHTLPAQQCWVMLCHLVSSFALEPGLLAWCIPATLRQLDSGDQRDRWIEVESSNTSSQEKPKG